jgi:hypothetical protein
MRFILSPSDANGTIDLLFSKDIRRGIFLLNWESVFNLEIQINPYLLNFILIKGYFYTE